MKVAILGATSQIARDLIVAFSVEADKRLYLFARRPVELMQWLSDVGLSERYPVAAFSVFGEQEFDAVINFVGVGNPAQALAMGSSIFDITLRFDEMVLSYLQHHPACKYLFLSSGAVFGSNFTAPVDVDTKSMVAINKLQSRDWYGVAKLYAECRHRALPELAIVDIRVFNYFSHTQDLNARFLITDILRAIRDKTVLKTSPDYIVRDFIHPSDFYRLVSSVLSAPAVNLAIDCYTQAPVAKPDLLDAMQCRFGLRYEIADASASINATGTKPHYYSLNTAAAQFGYKPSLSSLQGILLEAELALNRR
jgi:nucleoside-diphosphate-sugar epimerase